MVSSNESKSLEFRYNVPIGKAEAFKAHVSKFEGAELVTDQLSQLKEERIEDLTKPLEENKVVAVKAGYTDLMKEIFSTKKTPEQSVSVEIETPEDFALLREKIQGVLRTVDHPRQSDFVIDQFALLTGTPKKPTAIAQDMGVTDKRLKKIREHVFEKLVSLQSDPEVSRLIKFVPNDSSTTENK